MRTSLAFNNTFRILLRLCFSLTLVMVGTYNAHAQCPGLLVNCENDNRAFPRGARVYVDIDLRIWYTPQYNQIIAGLSSWNNSNQVNGSGVIYDFSGVPAGPGNYNVLHVLNTTLYTPNGAVDTSAL